MREGDTVDLLLLMRTLDPEVCGPRPFVCRPSPLLSMAYELAQSTRRWRATTKRHEPTPSPRRARDHIPTPPARLPARAGRAQGGRDPRKGRRARAVSQTNVLTLEAATPSKKKRKKKKEQAEAPAPAAHGPRVLRRLPGRDFDPGRYSGTARVRGVEVGRERAAVALPERAPGELAAGLARRLARGRARRTRTSP